MPQSAANRRPRVDNTSGYPGVHWDKARRKWLAEITVNGSGIHLGRFNSLNDAVTAREIAEQKYFGGLLRLQPHLPLIQPDDESIKFIALTQGQVAIVDAARYDWAMQWNWHALYTRHTRTYYAMRHERIGGAQKTFSLHRQLLGEPDGLVDHKNGDTLDCRLANLRVCTHAQNNANHRPQINNSSGCPGVGWHKAHRKWHAHITVNGKMIHLGYYFEKSNAIRVRQDAERRYFGEFAYSARKDVMRVEAYQPDEVNRYA